METVDIKEHLAHLEKDLQFMISHTHPQTNSSSSSSPSKKPADDKGVNLLRQKMRLLRRWRNGSEPCTLQQVEDLTAFLTESRRAAIERDLCSLTRGMAVLDEYSLILDKNCNNLRQSAEEDYSGLVDAVKRLQTNPDPPKSHVLHEIEARIRDLRESVNFLISKVEKEPAHGTPPSSPTRTTAAVCRFEKHPARSRVLNSAEHIHSMVAQFQHGCHINLGPADQARTCAENDVEVLRRQLRKVRRWQQSAEKFTDGDVDDLDLIINAIHRHVNAELAKKFENKEINDSSPETKILPNSDSLQEDDINERLI